MIKVDPMKIVKPYLKDRDYIPDLSTHRYMIYEVTLAEIIQDMKRLQTELRIANNRILVLEGKR